MKKHQNICDLNLLFTHDRALVDSFSHLPAFLSNLFLINIRDFKDGKFGYYWNIYDHTFEIYL